MLPSPPCTGSLAALVTASSISEFRLALFLCERTGGDPDPDPDPDPDVLESGRLVHSAEARGAAADAKASEVGLKLLLLVLAN